MAGVCVRRKVISRRTVTTTMHCFHYELCVNFTLLLFLVLLPHSASSTLLVGPKLCRKSEGLAYENAENQYSRHTIRQKMDPVAYIVRMPNSKSLTEALVFQPLTMSMSAFYFGACISILSKVGFSRKSQLTLDRIICDLWRLC